jgi:tetratricopeptide (TPR) repeat protein
MKINVRQLLLILVCVAVPLSAHAESARSLTARGNELYARGEYDKALEAYEQAATEQPDSAEIWFNKGNAYFQKGDYEKAREAYETAAMRTRDPSLEAGSHFNLGNTAFFDGQKQLGQEPKKALSQFESSVRHYQEALRVEPGFADAAKNIEVVRVKMKDVLDLIKKQEEQAKEQKAKQEELLKQLKEVVSEQESELEASGALKKAMDEDPGKDHGEEAGKLARDQSRTREKTGGVSEKLKELQPQANSVRQQGEDQARKDPARAAAEHLEKAMGAQKEAAEGLEERRVDRASDRQREALDQLEEALAELSGSEDEKQAEADRKQQCDAGQNEKKQGEQKAGQDQERNQETEQTNETSAKESDEDKKSKEEQKRQAAQGRQKEQHQGEKGQEQKGAEAAAARAALRDAPEDILREEKENRLQLERSHSGAYQPVERDW